MKFEEILPDFRLGAVIRRRSFHEGQEVHKNKPLLMSMTDLLADDWEFLDEAETIKVSKESITRSWKRMLVGKLYVTYDEALQGLIQELGFKDEV